MATQVTVDLDRCQGHGKCYLLASKAFAPIEDDDWGQAEALVPFLDSANDPDGELLRQVQIGMRACPESAIALSTDASSSTA